MKNVCFDDTAYASTRRLDTSSHRVGSFGWMHIEVLNMAPVGVWAFLGATAGFSALGLRVHPSGARALTSAFGLSSGPIGLRASISMADTTVRADSKLDLASLRASELKALLQSRGLSIDGCFDKASLLERALQYREQLEAPAPPPSLDPPAWAGDPPLEQGPSEGAIASLILLHGFGDTGSGFISQMGGPMVAMDGLRVIFPSAPRAMFGNFPVSSWLDLPSGQGGMAGGMAAAASMMRADSGAVQSAVNYVHALIRREIARGVPAERIVVGGFSQGGLVALRAALSFPDCPLGGALALSTFFGADSAVVAPANERLPLFVAHGEDDPIVPKAEGQRIVQCMARVAPSSRVEFQSYAGMAHASCPEEVRDVRAFVERVMRGAASRAADETGMPRAAEAPADPPDGAEAAAASSRVPAIEPEALLRMRAAELKQYLRGRGVPEAEIAACFERADLLARALRESSE